MSDITTTRLLHEAADLLSEQGENHEYDRAIVELTTRLLGLSHDDHNDIEAALRAGLVSFS